MKKRNMPKISAVILAVLICVFAGILIGKLKENYDPEIFSENYISVDEVKQELIFTVYSQEEWDEWFEGGKKDYLTGAVLDELPFLSHIYMVFYKIWTSYDPCVS